MLVRLALEEDVDDYVELTRAAVAESVRNVGFNPDKVRETFSAYINSANPTIFVAERTGRELVGFLNASISGYDFADGIYTTQEVVFVRPDFRGTRAAVLLVDELVRWSEALGALEITGGNDNGLFTESTARLLESRGFERVGTFLRRVRGAVHVKEGRQQRS
jgi:GNAT superfamily N-acetyltransferase